MSDTTIPRGPLFPPRDGPSLIDTPSQPPSPVTPPKPSEISLVMAAQIERAVVDVFAKRYGQTTMPFGQARDLVYLERDLIGTLVTTFAKRSDAS